MNAYVFDAFDGEHNALCGVKWKCFVSCVGRCGNVVRGRCIFPSIDLKQLGGTSLRNSTENELYSQRTKNAKDRK